MDSSRSRKWMTYEASPIRPIYVIGVVATLLAELAIKPLLQ
jgi:hypothetical protein